MAFKEANLYRDEKIVLDLHPHWVMVLKSVVLLVLSMALGVWVLAIWERPDNWVGTAATTITAALVVMALLYFLQRWAAWISTNFVVTTDRCIYREGILSKKGIEIPLDRINTIFFDQDFVDRILRAGTLTIESAGEKGIQTFEDVRNPVMVQQELYQQMEDNENRKFDRVRAPAAQLSVADEVAKLVALKDQGHLSAQEFESQKSALLNRPES